MQGAANPAMMMMALMGGGAGAMPPGVMQVWILPVCADVADAVKDAINRVFAGTGVQIAAALAYEANGGQEVPRGDWLEAEHGITIRPYSERR